MISNLFSEHSNKSVSVLCLLSESNLNTGNTFVCRCSPVQSRASVADPCSLCRKWKLHLVSLVVLNNSLSVLPFLSLLHNSCPFFSVGPARALKLPLFPWIPIFHYFCLFLLSLNKQRLKHGEISLVPQCNHRTLPWALTAWKDSTCLLH